MRPNESVAAKARIETPEGPANASRNALTGGASDAAERAPAGMRKYVVFGGISAEICLRRGPEMAIDNRCFRVGSQSTGRALEVPLAPYRDQQPIPRPRGSGKPARRDKQRTLK